MPHKCTNCGKKFKDGSEEILSGCPRCGWNKFRYLKQGETKQEEKQLGKKIEDESKKEKEKKQKLLEKAGLSWEGSEGSELSLKDLKKIEELGQKIIKRDQELSKDDIESFRLKKDGSYEINLESLINNEGIIISVGEDGKYIIDLESFLNK